MTRDRDRPARGAGLLALLLAAVALSPGASASPTARLRATTKSYVFTLVLGMPEHIWTPAQAKMMHPKTGEIMLAGSMAQAMPMGDTQRELEVDIDSRATGDVVVGASPTITVTEASVKGGATVTVPVDELRGVGAPANDLHHGNNVDLAGGGTYTVIVTLNGQRAVLQATAPR